MSVDSPPIETARELPAAMAGADAAARVARIADALSEEEALALIAACKNPKLATRMMSRLKERVGEEEGRRTLVEGKTNALLAALGISGSIASGLGVVGIPRLTQAGHPTWAVVTLGVLVVLMLGLGMLAALAALRVTRVAPAWLPPDASLVQADTIRHFSTDALVDAEPYTYDLIQARDFYRLMHSAKAKADAKADALATAQNLFVSFVVAVFIVMAAFVITTIVGVAT